MSESSDPAPLDYRPPESRRQRKPFTVLELVVVVAILSVLIAIAYAWLDAQHRPSKTVACLANLHSIGLAVLMYANDHRGAYPDSLDKLPAYMGGTTYRYVCPATNDKPATGSTTRAAAANVTAGGHLSYAYVGAGLTTAIATMNQVIAYEPPGRHNGWSNVLYADGHVTTVPDALLPTLLRATTTRAATMPTGH